MPVPPVLLAFGAIGLAFVLAKKKGTAPAPSPTPEPKPVEPIIWKPEPLPDDTRGGGGGTPPANDDPDVTVYLYTIQGNAQDAGPGLFAKSWTQDSSPSKLQQLAAFNKDLQTTELTPVVFVPDVSGQAFSPSAQWVELPMGQMPDAPVTMSTPEGNNYPSRPFGQGEGTWRANGARQPSLKPWVKGHKVAIPTDWSAPPSALAPFVEGTTMKKSELDALMA